MFVCLIWSSGNLSVSYAHIGVCTVFLGAPKAPNYFMFCLLMFRIFFDPPHYTVRENMGSFNITIVPEGSDLNLRVQVDYIFSLVVN